MRDKLLISSFDSLAADLRRAVIGNLLPILVYIFPFCSIFNFEDSFVNHLSVKLISSIKIIIVINHFD